MALPAKPAYASLTYSLLDLPAYIALQSQCHEMEDSVLILDTDAYGALAMIHRTYAVLTTATAYTDSLT